MIKEVERDFTISDQTLHYLVEISSANLSDSSQGSAMNEASIRDWVRYDAEVAKVIKGVDKKRLEFVTIGFE